MQRQRLAISALTLVAAGCAATDNVRRIDVIGEFVQCGSVFAGAEARIYSDNTGALVVYGDDGPWRVTLIAESEVSADSVSFRDIEVLGASGYLPQVTLDFEVVFRVVPSRNEVYLVVVSATGTPFGEAWLEQGDLFARSYDLCQSF